MPEMKIWINIGPPDLYFLNKILHKISEIK
jgi:hypothetical protein